VVVLGFISLNAIYINIIIPQKTIYRLEAQFQEMSRFEPEILVMGQSHAANAANPMLIPDSFNYADPGEDYEQTYYKTRKLMEEKNPASIFILTY
jgi:hypothetical protein